MSKGITKISNTHDMCIKKNLSTVLKSSMSVVMVLVNVVLRPSQQFFSHVRMFAQASRVFARCILI